MNRAHDHSQRNLDVVMHCNGLVAKGLIFCPATLLDPGVKVVLKLRESVVLHFELQ